jgi:hypothetical protein
MKYLNLSLFIFVSLNSYLFSQEIRLQEATHYFNIGSKNALVVNIPFGKMEIIEQELKKELKKWNGKYDSEKGEYKSIQANTKFSGNKPFDAYVKIIKENEQTFKVAFGIDLGGAFLNSKEHDNQFRAFNQELVNFARACSLACIEEELDIENKKLSKIEKDLRSLEKDKEKLEEDIQDYKKKIVAAERKIENNVQIQYKNKDEIVRQKELIQKIEKKRKSL